VAGGCRQLLSREPKAALGPRKSANGPVHVQKGTIISALARKMRFGHYGRGFTVLSTLYNSKILRFHRRRETLVAPRNNRRERSVVRRTQQVTRAVTMLSGALRFSCGRWKLQQDSTCQSTKENAQRHHTRSYTQRSACIRSNTRVDLYDMTLPHMYRGSIIYIPSCRNSRHECRDIKSIWSGLYIYFASQWGKISRLHGINIIGYGGGFT
jgi:hypothetical protein